MLSSKLSQLLLRKSEENKNEELEQANGELANANEELITLNERVQHLNLTLEKKVDERTGELQKANEELNTIFCRTSHDFRRPLTSILGLAQIAEMSTKDENSLQLFKHCKSVVAEMDAMLTKLSILSSLGTSAVEVQQINFHHVFCHLQEKFKSTLEEKAVDFKYDTAKHFPFHSDNEIITTILENLVENAICFHGINPYVLVRISQEGRFIKMQVIDNGQGIDSAEIGKVFNMYHRANEQSKGNGLGLYVVKKLVKLLEGEITVESKKKEGSTFTVLLPYQADNGIALE